MDEDLGDGYDTRLVGVAECNEVITRGHELAVIHTHRIVEVGIIPQFESEVREFSHVLRRNGDPRFTCRARTDYRNLLLQRSINGTIGPIGHTNEITRALRDVWDLGAADTRANRGGRTTTATTSEQQEEEQQRHASPKS